MSRASLLSIVTTSLLLAGCTESATDAPVGGGPVVQTPDAGFSSVFIEGGVPAARKPADKVTEQARTFFVDWLKGHGEENIVNDQSGVGVEKNATRLWAFLYGYGGSRTFDKMVELELRVVLPDGREIQEFVVGTGDDESKAIGLALTNFTLSTFHVVYSCFMNENDPHISHEDITIAGTKRQLTSGGIITMGDKPDGFDKVAEKIREHLSRSNLSNQVHWMKIVYSVVRGEEGSKAITLDNEDNHQMTAAMSDWDWPTTDSFYMAKEFIVIRPTE